MLFDLCHVPVLKALVLCACSIFEAVDWLAINVYFTQKTWTVLMMREAVMRSIFAGYNLGKTLPVAYGCNKAYWRAIIYDPEGYALRAPLSKRSASCSPARSSRPGTARPPTWSSSNRGIMILRTPRRRTCPASGLRIIHPSTIDPNHDSQHVPTVWKLYSRPVTEQMLALGYPRAARWVRISAGAHECVNRRGFCPAARWKAWAVYETKILLLSPPLQWDSNVLPTSQSIEGFSRCVPEAELVWIASSQEMEVMVSSDEPLARLSARHIYGRHKESDLVESVNSRATAAMNSRGTKTQWRHFFRKVASRLRATRAAR